jgi:hypothetical protein
MTYDLPHWAADRRVKTQGYADSILARLRLAVRAGGAIKGVRVISVADACPSCNALGGNVYQPGAAPSIPVAGCTTMVGCRCAYQPVMAFEVP